MIHTLLIHPLGPALLLALTGLLVRAVTNPARINTESSPAPAWLHWPAWLPDDLRVSPTAFGLIGTAAATLVLLSLRWLTPVASPPDLRWAWQPLTVAGSELNWRLDNWNWLVALLILLLVATTLLVEGESPPTRTSRTARTLWLGAAALVFVFSANVVTLAGAWVLLDAALALRLGAGETEEPAARAWSFMTLSSLLLLWVLLLLGEKGIRASLLHGSLDSTELGLLWLAALLRAGVYPFHLWLTGPGRLDDAGRVALHLIAPLPGLWLLARLHEIGGTTWLRRPEWVALGALALLGSALAAWTAEDQQTVWRWIAINRASLVVLAAYAADFAGPPALVWPVITFALGSALLAAGLLGRARWGWSWPVWLGALTVWGLPGTTGLLARRALVLPVNEPAALFLFALIIVAEVLLVAALWDLASREPASSLASRVIVLAPGAKARQIAAFLTFGVIVIVLAVPTVAWGVAPQQLGRLLGLSSTASSNLPLLQWLREARRSVWAVLAVSAGLGVALAVYRERIFSGMRGWQHGIAAIVRLDWLYSAVTAGLAIVGGGLRYFALLGEGEGYMGWLVLAALILFVLLRG